MNWTYLLLVTCEILEMFVNIMTAVDIYSRYNRENIRKQIKMQLSQKPKTFSGFSIAFLKSTSNC